MKTTYKILRFLPHLSIVFALCFLALTVLDWYNPLMAFTTNALSGKLMIMFCIVTILSSIGNLFLTQRLMDMVQRTVITTK